MHEKKESNMQEEKPRGEEANNPNHIKVRVFDKDYNGYKHVK
jgi:hypothetical protein